MVAELNTNIINVNIILTRNVISFIFPRGAPTKEGIGYEK